MGESYVAVADNASYFNPASLAGQTERKLHLTHAKWLPGLANDMSYEFVAYSQPVEGWGNVGLNGVWMNSESRREWGSGRTTFSDLLEQRVRHQRRLRGRRRRQHEGRRRPEVHPQPPLPRTGCGHRARQGSRKQLCRRPRYPVGPHTGAYIRLGTPLSRSEDGLHRPQSGRSASAAYRRRFAYELLDAEYHDVLLAFDLYNP